MLDIRAGVLVIGIMESDMFSPAVQVTCVACRSPMPRLEAVFPDLPLPTIQRRMNFDSINAHLFQQ